MNDELRALFCVALANVWAISSVDGAMYMALAWMAWAGFFTFMLWRDR